jgi:hypothetical protein
MYDLAASYIGPDGNLTLGQKMAANVIAAAPASVLINALEVVLTQMANAKSAGAEASARNILMSTFRTSGLKGTAVLLTRGLPFTFIGREIPFGTAGICGPENPIAGLLWAALIGIGTNPASRAANRMQADPSVTYATAFRQLFGSLGEAFKGAAGRAVYVGTTGAYTGAVRPWSSSAAAYVLNRAAVYFSSKTDAAVSELPDTPSLKASEFLRAAQFWSPEA